MGFIRQGFYDSNRTDWWCNVDLSPDEIRMIKSQREMSALHLNIQLTEEEWRLIKLRRIVQLSYVPESEIATSHPDPFREQCSVAIYALLELQKDVQGVVTETGKITLHDIEHLILSKLDTLGADATPKSQDSGSG